jgi:hypothetical protein
LPALTASQNRVKPNRTQRNGGTSPLSTADRRLRDFAPGGISPSPGNTTKAMASAAIDNNQIQYAGRRANSGTRNATPASGGTRMMPWQALRPLGMC